MVRGAWYRQQWNHHDRSAMRLVAVVMGVLLTLGALAYAGTFAIGRFIEHRRVVAMMGPQPTLASLPPMDFKLGGSRELELKVSLVLAPKADPDFARPYHDRIGDRLYDSIRELGPEGLTGPGSAEAVKRSVADAVRRETGRNAVRDVYIERMVLK